MKSRFSVPTWVWENQIPFQPDSPEVQQRIAGIRDRLALLSDPNPEVSVVIPAYNEEKDLLSTLSTLSHQQTRFRTEIIVVNNNSTDRTQEILDACGIRSFFEPRQGISFTRQTGLEKASGHYYLNADADSMYPPGWIQAHVEALQIAGVRCSYGQHSFIPEGSAGRIGLGLYEIISERYFAFRRMRKREYLNVLGFNFGILRQDALEVGGFNVSRQRWQDGWMALEMLKKGKLHRICTEHARVWTSDRRLKADGNLFKAFTNRIKIHVVKLYEYWIKKPGTRAST